MANKKYTVLVREKCLDVFDKHVDFLAKVSIEAAEGLVDGFWKTVNGLTAFPERNVAVYLDSKPGERFHRALLGKHHAVLYAIEGSEVYVEAVIDLRQNVGMSLF